MDLLFNQSPSTTMHIDLNSCFATIEQQANPLLRGKPLAVAAYNTPRSCILAPSIEAKRFGVKTGMRVADGKKLCPYLRVLAPDPNKYRYIYKRFCKLFSQYTPNMQPKSIDEAVLRFAGTPILEKRTMVEIGYEIKRRMRAEIGDWLSCNVGIAPNGSLAKLAAGLHKPDGLDVIDYTNVRQVFSEIDLEDFCGIASRYKSRLIRQGIYTPLDMLDASLQTLTSAFESVNGYYWYLRVRGWEIDDVEFGRKTVGHSYHLPKFTADIDYLSKLLYKLSEKMGRRLRHYGLGATGIHVFCLYADGSHFSRQHKVTYQLRTTKDLFELAQRVLLKQPEPKPVRIFSVNCFGLYPWQPEQLGLFTQRQREHNLSGALDAINDKWGEFTITSATMMNMENIILDRIAFGNVKDLTKPFGL